VPRRFLPFLTIPVLAALALACSSAAPPDEESTGSTNQAQTRCSAPFTVLSSENGKLVCQFMSGPPASTPPAYPPGAMTSCAGANNVAPPSALAGCTWGMGGGSLDPADTIYLCPSTMTLPPSDGRCPGGGHTYNWLGGPLDNGCFGDPIDPSYAFVYVNDFCLIPGNCGAKCSTGSGGHP
jgi:hypothetical protein